MQCSRFGHRPSGEDFAEDGSRSPGHYKLVWLSCCSQSIYEGWTIGEGVYIAEAIRETHWQKRKENCFECLLSLDAAIGKKDEVYRIWNLYKNMGKFNNNGYRSMLKSLVKMDDIVGAEKIVEEWESEFKQFDIQLPNLLVNA